MLKFCVFIVCNVESMDYVPVSIKCPFNDVLLSFALTVSSTNQRVVL